MAKRKFTDQTTSIAPSLQKAGMVTDAAWVDMNGDNQKDLVVAGEWMPVTIYINNKGKLENKTINYFDKNYTGWWNKLSAGDFNHDGKPDLIIGNVGLNTQCKASDKQPAEMYYKDFDDNGSIGPNSSLVKHPYSYISITLVICRLSSHTAHLI